MHCLTCNDENRRNCPECSTIDGRGRLQSSQHDTGDILCACGSAGKPKSLMVCNGCDKSWHSVCVGLDGLTQSLSVKINNWKCPLCFEFSPEVKDKLGVFNPVAQSEKLKIGKEDVAKELYKELLDVKDILINRIVPNTDKIEGMSKTASIALRKLFSEKLRLGLTCYPTNKRQHKSQWRGHLLLSRKR